MHLDLPFTNVVLWVFSFLFCVLQSFKATLTWIFLCLQTAEQTDWRWYVGFSDLAHNLHFQDTCSAVLAQLGQHTVRDVAVCNMWFIVSTTLFSEWIWTLTLYSFLSYVFIVAAFLNVYESVIKQPKYTQKNLYQSSLVYCTILLICYLSEMMSLKPTNTYSAVFTCSKDVMRVYWICPNWI